MKEGYTNYVVVNHCDVKTYKYINKILQVMMALLSAVDPNIFLCTRNLVRVLQL